MSRGIDYDDSVQMIGHQDTLIQDKSRIVEGQFIPHVVDHLALLIELLFSTILGGDYFSEQAGMILDADGDEVSSRLRVVVIG